MAGVSRRRFYDWVKDDPEFRAAVAETEQIIGDKLEKEAIRRAVDGVQEPVGWWKGKPGGYVQRYSDTLLIFLLKGQKPRKFAERFEHTGENGAPIQVQPIPKFATPQEFVAWVQQQRLPNNK